jgi:hypothetical protein
MADGEGERQEQTPPKPGPVDKAALGVNMMLREFRIL